MKRSGLWAGVAIVALAIFVIQRASYDSATGQDAISFVVKKGPLTISITESGTVSAREQVILKSHVEGQARIIWLIPEGTHATKGDLLVELDSSNLVDRRIDQQIRVQNREATYIGARENLAVVKNQAKSDVTAAELDYQFAQEDLTKYLEGDFPMEVKRSEADIALAESERSRSQEQLQGSKRLFQEGYLTGIEFERDKQMAEKAELELELARSALHLLHEYTYKRKMTELDSDIVESSMALERARLKASANVVQAEANFKAGKSEYSREVDKLAKLDKQIEHTKIYAPTDGLIVHATTARGHGWRSSQEPLEEGQMIRELQDLINMPTASLMMAEVTVHESNLPKIREGLGVRITVDAVPGKSFTGHVAHIAPMPDAQSAYMNPNLKVYKTDIFIDGDASALRTGMSCEAEIMIDRFESAIYVPVQSVFLVKGKPTAFVVNGRNEVEERELVTGLDNNRMIQVVSGLEVGEKVLLTPPLDAASKDWHAQETPASSDDEFVEANESRVLGPPKGDLGEGYQTPPRHGGDRSETERATQRQRFENMSPEERQRRIEERMQNASPEERARIERRLHSRGQPGGEGR